MITRSYFENLKQRDNTPVLEPLNQERLQKLTENYVVSNEKIKKALGVTHLPVSAKEGLIKTIKSFT